MSRPTIKLAGLGLVALVFAAGCIDTQTSPQAGQQNGASEPEQTTVGAGSPAAGDPTSLALPTGFQPESIATGSLGGRRYAYTASLAGGSIYRLDLDTGGGEEITPPNGTASVGVELDGRGRLFVADGPGGVVNGDPGGGARVIDARSGEVLASYSFSDAAALVNDVVATDAAVWFTDSINPVLYKLPLGDNGELPAPDDFEVLPLTGEFEYDDFASNIDGNGIEATPDGRALLMVQWRTGELFRVDPQTGASRRVGLEGGELPEKTDGLTLDGERLYATANNNTITVIDLSPRGDRGRITGTLNDPSFDGPANADLSGGRLYVPNVRFTVPSPKTARYDVVSVPVP